MNFTKDFTCSKGENNEFKEIMAVEPGVAWEGGDIVIGFKVRTTVSHGGVCGSFLSRSHVHQLLCQLL